MQPKSTAHSRWRRLLPVLALLLLPLLTACTEEFINAALGDPVPPVDGSEINLVTAEFDQDGGRMAIPNDLILKAVNEALVADGKAALTGTAKNMPIRIPFNGAISYPFAPGNTPSAAEVTAWGNKVFFAATADLTNPLNYIPATPSSNGGPMKAVYLDANNDLVIVPGAVGDTFAVGTTYWGVVTRDVTNTNGDAIGESVPMNLIKSVNPLVTADGKSVSTLVDDEQAADLELIRQGFAGVFAGLEAAGTLKDNISLLFNFTVETVDSVAAATAGIPALEGAATIVDVNPTMMWFDATNALQDLPANAADFKSTFADLGAPVADIQAIYHGVYTCQNFLAPSGEDWAFAGAPAALCPNSTSAALTGFTEFWLSIPNAAAAANALTGVAVFQHGITRDSTDFAAIANALASGGVATIAIDIFAHGTMSFQIAGADAQLIRPDDPEKTVGYMLQSFLGIEHLAAITQNSIELRDASVLNIPGGAKPVFFVGQSLGSILGALATQSGTTAFARAVFSVPGADLVDIVLKGEIGAELVAAVAADQGQAVDSPELNATLLGIELTSRHALSSGLVDPLALYDPATPATPANVLVQQMTGDGVIANDNTELLSQVLGLTLTTSVDGAGPNADARSRWIYDPGNYTPTGAGHGFLLDGETSATTQGQTQAVTYLLTGNVLDPSE